MISFSEIYKRANTFLSFANESHLPQFQGLLELKLEIFNGISFEELLLKINDCLVLVKTNLKNFNVLLDEPILNDKKDLILPIRLGHWGCFEIKKNLLDYDYQMIVLIIELIDEYYSLSKNIKDVDQEILDLSDSFHKFPVPILLLSSSGEIILHNADFGKLKILPNELFSKEDNEEIEIEDITYKIFRDNWTKGGQSYSLFSLSSLNNFSDNSKLIKASTTELGIITSSLAHELNNPLGGISAALSLLLIDEDFKLKFGITAKEMKNSIKRCSELINVFLGFSRAHPNNESGKVLTSSFRQSMDLLRFRMVESNICLNIDTQVKNSFEKSINPSILTMVFYLILNGVLTTYSKMKLLNQGWDNIITGVFEENIDSVAFHFKVKDLFKNGFELEKSKLIKNLLQIENLEFEVLDESLIIQQIYLEGSKDNQELILPYYEGQQELLFH